MTAYKASPKEKAQGTVREGVLYLPDLRELCITARSYSIRTEAMAVRQGWKCAICTRIMGRPTFDHESGRGMNGSHRDDSLRHLDGTWMNAALCEDCNTRKGSTRYRWIVQSDHLGRKRASYQPVPTL